MKFYRSEKMYYLLIYRGFRTSGALKNVAGDHIYHLAKYGLMGIDPDHVYAIFRILSRTLFFKHFLPGSFKKTLFGDCYVICTHEYVLYI